MNYAKAAFKAAYGLHSQLPALERPEIVFSGRSNVGKSSLINKLCRRKSLARVSGVPGKTATINYYEVDDVYFVDLPGYGYAKVGREERRRWDELINGYFSTPRPGILLVQLLDSRHAPSEDDITMLEYLRHYGIPFIVALTKVDKLKKSQQEEALTQFETLCNRYGCAGVYLTSAETGQGVETLQAVLENHLAEQGE